MNDKLLYCATDKEIFDVLMSSKKQIPTDFMLELAKDRGIFYSRNSNREILSNNLSLMPHDYNDIRIILDQREHSGRAEKITSFTFNTELTVDEIKEASREYQEQASSDETIITNQSGVDKCNITVQYSDIDYSKNRLVQRREKEANIEFIIEGDKTTVRLPSNERTINIVENIKKYMDNKKKMDIPVATIELSMFPNPVKRTRFFTSLISDLPGFKLENVTSVKVESNIKESKEDSNEHEDDQNDDQVEEKMLALVKNVALKGQSLLASPEYKQLKDRGFFITSIIWQSKETSPSGSIIEFDAGFEDAESCKGFKYNVRGAHRFQDGNYTKTVRRISDREKDQYLSLIEQTARNTLNLLKEDPTKGDYP